MRTPFVIKLLIVAAAAVGVIYLVKPSLLPIAALKNSRPVMDILKEHIAAATGAAPSAGNADGTTGKATGTADKSTPASTNPIVKCLVNGKVLYTNEKCPTRSSAEPVSLQKWSGVAAPNKDLLDEISSRREAEHSQQAMAAQQAGEPDARSRKIRCNALILEADTLLEQANKAESFDEGRRLAEQKIALQARADAAGCR